VDLAAAFRVQADACADLGSPLCAELLTRAAADIERGGPVRDVLAGHEHDSGPSALALRLLGSVHRLVLDGRAGDLAAYYPSVGGTWDADGGWSAFAALLRDQPDAAREWLDRPPQTNEVGRATALYGGLLQLPGDLPVRLLEIGSSAGLNLRADRFCYVDRDGRQYGERGSEVVLDPAWVGRHLDDRPVAPVVERLGSDVRPIDPTTPEGRLMLSAYVWPDQLTRFERLRAALRVAEEVPAEVRAEDARTFVEAARLVEGTSTVLWHSVMWQYLTVTDQAAVTARIEELGTEATPQRRFAHLRAEPSRRIAGGDHRFLVRLRTWPDGEDRILGETAAHGVPTTWE
jgi:hypothetical protein